MINLQYCRSYSVLLASWFRVYAMTTRNLKISDCLKSLRISDFQLFSPNFKCYSFNVAYFSRHILVFSTNAPPKKPSQGLIKPKMDKSSVKHLKTKVPTVNAVVFNDSLSPSFDHSWLGFQSNISIWMITRPPLVQFCCLEGCARLWLICSFEPIRLRYSTFQIVVWLMVYLQMRDVF